MAESQSFMIYSVQRTYILTPSHVSTSEKKISTSASTSKKKIITCNQRIDIPTIEPLLTRADGDNVTMIIVPCIELAGDSLAEFDLTFETNEGVTVLPTKIDPMFTPYRHVRYALVLPRGATGVKSCKLIHKATGNEVQHNFTFGIMPPPYNYDNALFGTATAVMPYLEARIENLERRVTALENKAGG